ncbi:ATP-binding protein [Levilactobacillus bambusae]|uniref:ATPase n=1 Tax=Levilactobacillus bambusae TaxID=2024736 RepID=A0A2V1N5H0_9LACO|nr:ATP-binding protein [Levilactobacillus bambusae]PWG00900.1 ATPase [Levilactobacillus bambusae]
MALTFPEMKLAVNIVLNSGNVPAIVGDAGIGKSALVREVAADRGAQLFTTVVSLSEKGDLAIPVPPLTDAAFIDTQRYGRLADVAYGYSHTLIEIIEAAERHPDQPIIWFLDEFNRGTQAVQSELMNLVLQRQINTLKLPDQVQLILAENPDASMTGFEQTAYGVTPGDAAINDRTVRLVLTADSTSWLTWAGDHINGLVKEYLEQTPGDLMPTDHDEDLYPTPRAWERVSDILNQTTELTVAEQETVLPDLITGNLGVTVGQAFYGFVHTRQPGLTVKQFYTQPESVVLATLKTLSPSSQQHVLELALTDPVWPLTQDQTAARFLFGLQQLPLDGQYAVALKLAEQPDELEILNQAANDQPSVAKLYQRLTEIGSQGLEA